MDKWNATKEELPVTIVIQGVEVIFSRRTPTEVGIMVLEFFDRFRDSTGVETPDPSSAPDREAHSLPETVSNL